MGLTMLDTVSIVGREGENPCPAPIDFDSLPTRAALIGQYCLALR